MSKRNFSKTNRKFKPKRLPMATKRIDNAQNKKIQQIDKRIRRIETSEETKYLVTAIQFTGSDTPTPLLLNDGIDVGTTSTQRIGNKYTATSLTFKGLLATQSLRLLYSVARIIVFWCNSPLAGPPTVVGNSATAGNNCLLNNAGVTTFPNFATPYSLEFVPTTYKPIYDRTYVINPSNVATSTVIAGVDNVTSFIQTAIPINFKLKFRKTVRYDNDNAGTVTDISSGSLWLCVITDNSTHFPILSGMTRFIFKDT